MKSILVERITGKVYATHEDSDQRVELQGNDHQIHTALATAGYKRIGAAVGDELAGEYVRPSWKEDER